MQLIRGLANLKPHHRGSVASIGNYDGVHLGHQAVLKDLVAKARSLGLPATVVVFEPMPQEYFAARQPPARLTRFMEKWPLFAAAGVDRVLCLKFGRALAEMEPEAFIQRLLVEGLGLKHLSVGDDFRFGRERRGDFTLLEQAGRSQGFEVSRAASLVLAGERVSSTRVRAALAAGEMRQAADLLGRSYSLSGRVLHGARLGRQLGFPTVNLALKRRIAPLDGIFAARVQGLGVPQDAVAYIGRKPALGGSELVLEAHLLDFDGELYGRRLSVEFLQRLREDRHFDSLDALGAQIRADVQAARAWLAQHG